MLLPEFIFFEILSIRKKIVDLTKFSLVAFLAQYIKNQDK